MRPEKQGCVTTQYWPTTGQWLAPRQQGLAAPTLQDTQPPLRFSQAATSLKGPTTVIWPLHLLKEFEGLRRLSGPQRRPWPARASAGAHPRAGSWPPGGPPGPAHAPDRVAWPGRGKTWVKYTVTDLSRAQIYRRVLSATVEARLRPAVFAADEEDPELM